MPTGLFHHVEGYTIDRPRDSDRYESLYVENTGDASPYDWTFTNELNRARFFPTLEEAENHLGYLQRSIFAHSEWDYHFRIVDIPITATPRRRATSRTPQVQYSELTPELIQ